MELRHLRYFVAVAEEGSFTRAAARLHMAQPPLSTQIRRVEAQLGVELFDRTGRGIRLTDAGRALLPEARGLLAASDRAVELVQRVGRGEVGRLAVGFIPSASAGALPPILRAYRQARPDVALELRERSPDALVAGLHDRSLDVAFFYRPLDDDVLDQRLVAREPLVAALPAGHPLAHRHAVAVAELAAEPFVLPARHELPGLHAHIVELCRDHGFDPRVAQSDVWLVQTIVGLVGAGVGVALVPASARLPRDGVAFRPLRPEGRELELIAAWRRGAVAPVLAGFLDAV